MECPITYIHSYPRRCFRGSQGCGGIIFLTGAETAVGETGHVHLALLPQPGPCASQEASHLTECSFGV